MKNSKLKEKWAQFKEDMKEIAAVEELEAPNVGTSNKTASESAAERQEELEKEIVELSKKLHAGATEETTEETSTETAAEAETAPETTPAETAPETTPAETAPETTPAETAPETTPETPEAPTKTEEAKAEPKTEPKEAKASEPEQPAEHEKAKEPEASAKAKSEDEVKAASEAEAGNVLSEEEVEVIQEALDAPKPGTSRLPKPRKELEVPNSQQEAAMIVRSIGFYDKLPDLAFEKDVRGAKNEELDKYLVESIKARPDLLEEIIDEHFEEFLSDNPDRTDSIVYCNLEDYLERNLDDTSRVDQIIRRVHDRNIKVAVRFVEKGDPEKLYPTWKEAVASIQGEINRFGIDPKNVFQPEYYRTDDPEKTLSEAEAQKYVNNFRGDKKALKKALHLNSQPKSGKSEPKSKDKPDKGKSNK